MNTNATHTSPANTNREERAIQFVKAAQRMTGYDRDASREEVRIAYEQELIRLAMDPAGSEAVLNLGLPRTGTSSALNRSDRNDQCRAAVSALELEEGDIVILAPGCYEAAPFVLRDPAKPELLICVPYQTSEVEEIDWLLKAFFDQEIPEAEARFLGTDVDLDLAEFADGRPVKVLEYVRGRSEAGYDDYRGWGPLSTMQFEMHQSKRFFVSGKSSAVISEVVIWNTADCGDHDPNIHVNPDNPDEWEPFAPFAFNDDRLLAVAQLPAEDHAWVFAFSNAHTEVMTMADLSDVAPEVLAQARGLDELAASGFSARITRADLYVNAGFYTPKRYTHGYEGTQAATLGSLCTRISRGTSLSGKQLKALSPSHGSLRMLQRLNRGEELPGGTCLYVDTSSILEDGLTGDARVKPQTLSATPEGQERYIVQQGETVLLVPRNGKRPALYKAAAPTLVSNNLFVAWLKSGWASKEYARLILTSEFVCKQLGVTDWGTDGASEGQPSVRMLSKKTLEGVIVPVPSAQVQAAAVENGRRQAAEIRAARERIGNLVSMSAFEYGALVASKAEQPEA